MNEECLKQDSEIERLEKRLDIRQDEDGSIHDEIDRLRHEVTLRTQERDLHRAEIERLALDRDEQAELRAHHFDRANKLSIENKALRKHIESLIVAQEEEAIFGPHNEIPSLNAEIERLQKAAKAGAKMIRWIMDHKDRMHAVAWLDALETVEMMEALVKVSYMEGWRNGREAVLGRMDGYGIPDDAENAKELYWQESGTKKALQE